MIILDNQNKLGKFTGSRITELMPGEKDGTKVRSKYIFEKAKEIVQGYAKSFTSKRTDHGLFNEHEGIEAFCQVSGLTIESLGQQYFPINENCGATPDAAEKNFDDVIVASVDLKCPTDTFFEQKMQLVNESKPIYQNSPRTYFYQAQAQMMALTEHNKKLGHPPVNTHYLVRYLTNWEIDDNGNKKEIDLPLESRLFWKKIVKDENVCNAILQQVAAASIERDLLVRIFKKPIYGDF